ncbi:Eisosome assembly protein [Savitreella phatthalungensis]
MPPKLEDPRDIDTMKWLAGTIDATPAGSSTRVGLPAPALTQDSEVSANAAALATEKVRSSALAPPIDGRINSSPSTARNAAIMSATAGTKTGSSSPSRNSVPPISQHGESAAFRASQLAAAASTDSLYSARADSSPQKSFRLSSAGAAASLAHAGAAAGGVSSSSSFAQRDASNHSLASRAGAANKAALRATNEPVVTDVPQRSLPSAAGTAALLAHHDARSFAMPEHRLSENAGKAALLAAEHPVSVELPSHQLSASASHAALLSAEHPVNVETPVHKLSASASTAALYSVHNPVSVDLPEHELSNNASKAALLAHHDPKAQAQPQANPASAASAANALKAATQAHHDPAVQPKPREDLQSKGAANALKAATQAHRDAAPPFRYQHPADDPEIGALARRNTQAYMKEMDFPEPSADTLAYANISFQQARDRELFAAEAPSQTALQSASVSHSTATDLRGRPGRDRSNTAGTSASDLLAIARRNVDTQLAERGLTRTESHEGVQKTDQAQRASGLAFQSGQDRQADNDRELAGYQDEREISARISREMAAFDRQRRMNQSNSQVPSALMAAAQRNARLSMQQLDIGAGYRAPTLQETSRVEDLLNEERAKARKDRGDDRQIDIGGGHFMSQIEIEQVAARRIQPVFDEMDEQVALINKRKEETRQREEAEKQRRAEQKAAEREKKEQERKAKDEAKAAERAQKDQSKREAAEAKAAEKQRKQEEDSRRRAEAAEASRLRKEQAEESSRQRRKEQEEASQQKRASKAAVPRSASTEAVATAGTAVPLNNDVEPVPTANAAVVGTALPGDNAPLPGQKNDVKGKSAVEPANLEAAAGVDAGEGTSKAAKTEGDPIATYQVDNPVGMQTDTENETEDEWVDAIEETPAVERDDPVAANAVHLRAKDDADNVSVATARPQTKDGDSITALPIDGTTIHRTTSATGGSTSKFVEILQ